MKGIWRNNKTGKLYIVTGMAFDATNDREKEIVVKYEDAELDFVRELKEFTEKFTAVELIKEQ